MDDRNVRMIIILMCSTSFIGVSLNNYEMQQRQNSAILGWTQWGILGDEDTSRKRKGRAHIYKANAVGTILVREQPRANPTN